MAEVLSQSEIDALLTAVSAGDVDTAPGSAAHLEWAQYDFASQEKVLRQRLKALDGIHERFARDFRHVVSDMLKKSISVRHVSTEFMPFQEFLPSVMLPAYFNILGIKQLGGHILTLVSSKLAYALIDSYYGGTEIPFHKVGGRETFTRIETNMVRKFCREAVPVLERAWEKVLPIHLEQKGAEQNPQFIGQISGSEPVAIVTFDIELENLSGPLILILQIRALATLEDKLSQDMPSDFTAELAEWRAHWLRAVLQSPIEIRAELGNVERTVQSIQRWVPGDMLALNQDATTPIQVLVAGVPKFRGLLGTCRGNQAVRLLGKLDDEGVELPEDPSPEKETKS